MEKGGWTVLKDESTRKAITLSANLAVRKQRVFQREGIPLKGKKILEKTLVKT